jgi:hypothetical protein
MLNFAEANARRLEGDYRLLNKCFGDLENLFTIWNEPNMQSYEQMVLPLVSYLTSFLKEEVKKATSGNLLKMSGLEPSSDNAESAMDIDLDEVRHSANKSSLTSVPFAESSEKVKVSPRRISSFEFQPKQLQFPFLDFE